jgi:hypothetical protein
MTDGQANQRSEPWQPDGTELDFWIGEWDVTWGESGLGTNRLTRILNGRVIREEFSGAGPKASLEGLSVSVYDPDRRLWRQTWVDDQGGYLDLVGDRMDGVFVFRRAALEIGPGTEQRMAFRDIEADAFRWTWEQSPDAGVTWVVRWEIDYRRR